MLGLAGHAMGNWMFFAVGVSPAVMLACVMFTWAAVRSSLDLSTQWLTSGRVTMNSYLLAMIVVIAAAGLTGCASQSEWQIQFFKASGHILTVSQNAPRPSVPK